MPDEKQQPPPEGGQKPSPIIGAHLNADVNKDTGAVVLHSTIVLSKEGAAEFFNRILEQIGMAGKRVQLASTGDIQGVAAGVQAHADARR